MAGELELICRPNISEDEKQARLLIAKTIAYHKLYVTDEELRKGYDSVMKSVEQEAEAWSPKLADELNKFYEFRANAVLREKLEKGAEKLTGSGVKKTEEGGQGGESKEDGEDTEKMIYCMDFNKGICQYNKSHMGKWRSKKVMKYHMCRICLKNNDVANHSERECKKKA